MCGWTCRWVIIAVGWTVCTIFGRGRCKNIAGENGQGILCRWKQQKGGDCWMGAGGGRLEFRRSDAQLLIRLLLISTYKHCSSECDWAIYCWDTREINRQETGIIKCRYIIRLYKCRKYRILWLTFETLYSIRKFSQMNRNLWSGPRQS